MAPDSPERELTQMGEQGQATAMPEAPAAVSGPPAPSEPARSRTKLVVYIERYALVVALLGLIVLFSVLPATSETFLTGVNIRNVLATQAVVSIAAIAVLIPLVCAQFDISVGSLLGLAAYAVGAALQKHGFPLVPGIALGIVICALIGVLNGWLVAYVRANSIIITLGMATLATGLVSLYSKDATLVGVPDAMSSFASGMTLGIPRPTWVLVVVALAVWYVLRFTVYGRQLLMIGSSERAAELVGVRTKRVVFAAFVLSATIAGIAGALALARSGSASPAVGPGYTLPAVAAVFLGSTTIRPGQFNVPGTIVGVFFVAVSVNGLTLAGTASWVDPVFNGAAVVIAVAASTMLLNRRAGRRGGGAAA
jgi:ribose transport system permease protein